MSGRRGEDPHRRGQCEDEGNLGDLVDLGECESSDVWGGKKGEASNDKSLNSGARALNLSIPPSTPAYPSLSYFLPSPSSHVMVPRTHSDPTANHRRRPCRLTHHPLAYRFRLDRRRLSPPTQVPRHWSDGHLGVEGFDGLGGLGSIRVQHE